MNPTEMTTVPADPVDFLKEVSKLMDDIAKANEHGSTVAQQKIMRELRDKWTAEEPVLAVTACQGLLILVEKGLVPVQAAIEMMVVAIPNIRNYAGVTSTIGTLLKWDLQQHTGDASAYVCPYGIMKNQHPLIKLLLHHPDTWSDVFTVIESFSHGKETEGTSKFQIPLLRPVFEFVLCDPQAKPYLPSMSRRQLWTHLLKGLSQESVRELILKSLQWMQFKQKERAVEAGGFLQELCEAALLSGDVHLAMALAPFLASHIRTLVALAVDPSTCLRILRQLVQIAPESSSCSVLLLADAISACPAAYLDTLIITCQNLIKPETTSHVSACAVIFALLPWFAAPSVLTSDALRKARSLVSSIYQPPHDLRKQHTSALTKNAYFSALRHCDSQVHIAASACRILENWRSKEDVARWLVRVRNSEPEVVLKLVAMIGAVLLSDVQQSETDQSESNSDHSDPHEEPVLRTLLWFVTLDPNIGKQLFFLFTHALTKEQRPSMQIALLRAITGTAQNQDTVPLVLAILRAMKAEEFVARNLTIDLYFRLWTLQSRCFRFLHEALASDTKNESSKVAWQMDLARVATIKQMCIIKPEAHSQDLLPIVSSIMSQHNTSAGALPAALCLDCITAFSRSGILDVVSAWRSLSSKLANEKRPLVIISVCDLLGLMGRLPTGDKTPDNKYEAIVEEAIIKLWHYVSMTAEERIVNAALRALAQFSVYQMKLKMVPPILRKHVNLDPDYIKTPVDAGKNPMDVYTYVPEQVWKNLILEIGSRASCRETVCETLALWVGTELTSLPKSAFALMPNRAEPASLERLPKASLLRALMNFSMAEETRGLALGALARNMPRLFPPVNWQFLEGVFKNASKSEGQDSVRSSCLTIAARQCTLSGSATQFLMNYISSCNVAEDKVECEVLFSNLHSLGKAIPASYVGAFVIKGLQCAVTSYLAEEDPKGLFLESLLQKLEVTLQKTVNEEFTKTVANIVENFSNAINPNHSVYPAYVSCAAILPAKNRDKLTLPSLWWDISVDKLKLAALIQSAVSEAEEYDMPLALLNDCIDCAASAGQLEQECVLEVVYDAILKLRSHESNSQWMCQLLGRIQRVTINDAHLETKKQVVQMLCDVLLLSTVVLSGFEIFLAADRLVVLSREERLLHFPQALASLLQSSVSWQGIENLVVNWLNFMVHSETVNKLLAETFRHALVAVRYGKPFRSTRLWMNILV